MNARGSDIPNLIAEGASCRSRSELRQCVRSHLRRVAPADEIDFLPLDASEELQRWTTESRYASRLLDHYPHIPESNFRAGLRAAWANGGVFADTDVYSEKERSTLPLFAEVAHPLGLRSQVVVLGSFRGSRSFTLFLSRYGHHARPFLVDEVDAVRALVSQMCVLEAAFRDGAPKQPSKYDSLTLRERQVAELTACGLRNADIAAELGTSINTVRKQVISIFDKLGVDNRTQLAARLNVDLERPRSARFEYLITRCLARRPR